MSLTWQQTALCALSHLSLLPWKNSLHKARHFPLNCSLPRLCSLSLSPLLPLSLSLPLSFSLLSSFPLCPPPSLSISPPSLPSPSLHSLPPPSLSERRCRGCVSLPTLPVGVLHRPSSPHSHMGEQNTHTHTHTGRESHLTASSCHCYNESPVPSSTAV